VKGITMRAFSLLLAFVAALLLTTTASANLIDDTPPPAPTEVVDPYGDGEDENGLIPDDNGEDIDEELNSQPFADQDADPVAVSGQDGAADQTQDSEGIDENRATVTQLPDTGVGSYVSEQSGFFLGAIIAMAGFLMGLWAATRGRRY
jgi:hypothetical protein